MVDRRALGRAPRGVLRGRIVGEETQRQGERRYEAGRKTCLRFGKMGPLSQLLRIVPII
jgi:hypothetical protein